MDLIKSILLKANWGHSLGLREGSCLSVACRTLIAY